MNVNNARFLASYGLASQLPQSDLVEFVFSGRSNVGKSSLINKLLHRKALAKVSGVPGKTATVNFYDVGKSYFVDLPGYGYARTAKSEKLRWRQLVQKYFESSRNVGFVIQLIDMRHPPTKLDLEMIHWMIACEMPFVVALTKADKLNKTQTAQRLDSIYQELPYGDQLVIVPCSVQTGQGVQELHQLMDDVVEDEQNRKE